MRWVSLGGKLNGEDVEKKRARSRRLMFVTMIDGIDVAFVFGGENGRVLPIRVVSSVSPRWRDRTI